MYMVLGILAVVMAVMALIISCYNLYLTLKKKKEKINERYFKEEVEKLKCDVGCNNIKPGTACLILHPDECPTRFHKLKNKK